jgi:hypothetical protein
MHYWVIFGLNVSPVLPALISAYYWWRSALVRYPLELRGITPHGAASVDTRPLVNAALEAARFNKIAASFSALTAGLTAAAYITTALIPPAHTP